MSKYYTTAIWIVKEGNEKAFQNEWRDFARYTSENYEEAKKGRLIQDVDNASTFISFGKWESIEAINDWRDSDEFQMFLERMKILCEKIDPHKGIQVRSSEED